jgi:SpoIID/LytB domain protein
MRPNCREPAAASVGFVGQVRRSKLLVATALVLSACTLGNEQPPSPLSSVGAIDTTSASARSSPAPPTASRSAGANAASTANELMIESRGGGPFVVHGRYPRVSTSCRGAVQPTFEAQYPGTLVVDRADDGTLRLTVVVSFEQYLEGIAEVPPSWPPAALEAQAIAARSYALAVTGWSGPEGSALGTPICSTSSCQVFRGIPVERTPGIRRWYAAVRRTAGKVLQYEGRPIEAVYYSTSNGHTYGNDEVFGSDPLPYLRPRVERDDGASPTSTWHVTVPFSDLSTFLGAAGLWPMGSPVRAADRKDGSIVVRGGGTTRTLDIDTFDSALNTWAPCLSPDTYPTASRFGPALPATVPSEWYTLADTRHSAVLHGRGWGHGVGMVQWGAYGKAKRGWSAARILAYYYGDLRPRPFPEPGLIRVQVADGLTSLAVDPTTAGTMVDGRRIRPRSLLVRGGEALRLLPTSASKDTSTGGSPMMASTAGFEGEVSRIGTDLRARLTGRNWHPGCPVPIKDLRLVRVSYWTLDGQTRVGPLVVNERVADDVLWVFRRLFRARFPIHHIGLPPRYRPPRPSDWDNTRNLTSAFNCRPATGNPTSLSHHSYGWAIDVNPLRNPYVGPDGTVLRRAAKPFLDRTRRMRGMIHPNDVVVRSFAAIGWEWGGDWSTLKDYMHFSLTGR